LDDLGGALGSRRLPLDMIRGVQQLAFGDLIALDRIVIVVAAADRQQGEQRRDGNATRREAAQSAMQGPLSQKVQTWHGVSVSR